ncbi:NPP1 family protein [Promicromonospora sp. NPDC050880]|uniref:NPP1 family protein n=1 Tax=Promicromonospora sp. NPDC050880 TaxID=3364406 RepID=UPI003791CB2B
MPEIYRPAPGSGAASRPHRPERPAGVRFTAIMMTTLLALVLPATAAHADPPQALPESAGDWDTAFSPIYDYDTDGCYPTPAIGPDGTIAPGLGIGGDMNGQCRDWWDLDNTQTYSRAKCNNGWCAFMYASYFEKDQAAHGGGASGHRHDWEHVVVWVKHTCGPQGCTTNPRVEYVSVTHHNSSLTWPRSEVLFLGEHPKIVYHKDGVSTHVFRRANSNDDPPENHYRTWRQPPIIDWNHWPSTWLRDRLVNADFGSAAIKIKDWEFEFWLEQMKPAGIPFQPWA